MNEVIGTGIPAALAFCALLVLGYLYLFSQERRQLLYAIGATVIACLCLSILLLEHI